MSRNDKYDERDWRRQRQDWQEQDRWSRDRQEDESGWTSQGQEGRYRRDDEYGRRGPEMENRWREQGRQERERNYGTEERRDWQGMNRGMDRGMDRNNEGWEGRRGGMQGRTWESNYGNQRQPTGWDPDWQNWSDRYEGLGGGGWRQGVNEAMHRGEGRYTGRGPRNFKRADNRIEEDINERLTQHSMIDATDVEVTVQNGEVTLRGHVDDRQARRLAEDLVENVFGVKEINNQIKVKQRDWEEGKQRESETSGKQRKAS